MDNRSTQESGTPVFSAVVDSLLEFTDQAVNDAAELPSLGNPHSANRVLVDAVDHLIQFTDEPMADVQGLNCPQETTVGLRREPA